MLFAERDENPIVGGGGLQFEVEGPAEALAQRESQGPVDARAEGRVEHKLHAAAFVEKPLRDNSMLRRQGAQRSRACPDIGNSLLRSRVIESAFIGEKFHCSPIRLTAKVQNSLAKLRHFVRELTRSSWRFPQPKRDRRRRAVRIFHIDPSRPHTFDAPRMSA